MDYGINKKAAIHFTHVPFAICGTVCHLKKEGKRKGRKNTMAKHTKIVHTPDSTTSIAIITSDIPNLTIRKNENER